MPAKVGAADESKRVHRLHVAFGCVVHMLHGHMHLPNIDNGDKEHDEASDSQAASAGRVAMDRGPQDARGARKQSSREGGEQGDLSIGLI